MLRTFRYLSDFQKDVAQQIKNLRNQKVDPSLSRMAGASGPLIKATATEIVKTRNIDYQVYHGTWWPTRTRSPYHRISILAQQKQANEDLVTLDRNFDHAISQQNYDDALAQLSDFMIILICMYKDNYNKNSALEVELIIYPNRITGVAEKLQNLVGTHDEFLQKLFTDPVGEQCLYDVYEGLCEYGSLRELGSMEPLDNFKKSMAPFLSKEKLSALAYPLHRAARDNNYGTFKTLLGLGADIRHTNEDGKTAFEMSFDAFINSGNLQFHCFRAYIGDALMDREKNNHRYDHDNAPTMVLVSRKVIPGAKPTEAPAGSKYTAKVLVDAVNVTREVLVHAQSQTDVATVNKKQGIYREVRQKVIQAINPAFLTTDQAAALLRAGEFETFIFLKWLCHIEFSENPAELYSTQSRTTGDTLLHYLARAWTDADFELSNLQKVMYIDMMEHIIAVCGEDARKICNNADEIPADVCRGREIRTLTGARSIRMYPWTSGLIPLGEIIANAFISAKCYELTRLPIDFSANPLALPERIIALFRERGDRLSRVDRGMLERIIDISLAHQKKVAEGDVNYRTGDYLINLALEIKKLSAQERSLVTHQDKPDSFFYRNGSVMIDELLEELFENKSIEVATPDILTDQFLCQYEIANRRAPEEDEQGQQQGANPAAGEVLRHTNLPQYAAQHVNVAAEDTDKRASADDNADPGVRPSFQ